MIQNRPGHRQIGREGHQIACQGAAFEFTLGDALRKHVSVRPHATAVEGAGRTLTYRELNSRVNRLAGALLAKGVKRGDRVAILSENCVAYIELELAAAKLGLIVPCLNWRLSADELGHCMALTSPSMIFVSQRYAAPLQRISHGVARVVHIERDYEGPLAASSDEEPSGSSVEPEDGLVILYTSGTTGRPKGAVISQRAMAATDFSLATLIIGGKVTLHDGLHIDRLCQAIEREFTGGWSPCPA